MTPLEIYDALGKFTRSVGPRAEATVGVYQFGTKGLAHLHLYPNGLGNSKGLELEAASWEELFAKAETAWPGVCARKRAEAIRNMALAIIKITADKGACSDFALRADKFSQEEIDLYSEEAIADANAIASNGPFSIVRTEKANAA